MIRVYDSFFTEEVVKKLNEPRYYKFGWPSNTKKGYNHWNIQLVGVGPEPEDPMYDNLIHNTLENAWKIIQQKTGKRRLRRAYFNGYAYGTGGYIHKDFSKELDEEKMPVNAKTVLETVLVYCNEKWDPDWAGETIFLDKENGYEVIAGIMPKSNRVVVFPGNIPHVGRDVSRICDELRVTLAFKTAYDYYDEEQVISVVKNLTSDMSHSFGRSFFDHLYKTMMILKTRGMPQSVYLSGLCHSLYDTESYKANLNLPREFLQNLIGINSEKLVHHFCTIRPRSKILESKEIDEVERYHLAAIELANLTEQNIFNPYCQNLIDYLQSSGPIKFKYFSE
jgi:SM-20-related protein